MPEKGPGARGLRKRVLFSLTAVVLFFILLETVIRLTGVVSYGPHEMMPDDTLLWGIMKGQKMMAPDNKININSHGFRGREVSITPPPATYRIACTGDSSVFGVGIDEGETFIEVLVERLKEEFPGLDFEPLNFGVPGHSTFQSLIVLEQKIVQFEPDLLIVANFWSDKYRGWGMNRSDRDIFAGQMERRGTIRDIISRILMNLHFYRAMIDLFKPRLEMTSDVERRMKKNRELPPPRVNQAEYRNNLSKFADAGKRYGFDVVFLLLPFPPDMGGIVGTVEAITLEGIGLDDYRGIMREVARETGSILVDAPVVFKDLKGDASCYFGDHVHPSPAGHRAIGDAIFDELMKHDTFRRGVEEKGGE